MRRILLRFLFFFCTFLLSTLRAQQPFVGSSEVYIVPFSHLDLFWACTQEECLSRGNYIISRAIQLANQYPEFRFLIETEVFVADFEATHRGTAELETFHRLVKEGRIEVAPLWAAIYQNQPRDEALVRNLFYGKRYAREVFGVDPQVAHLADIPGFTRQYPQILRKSSTPFLVMTRMGPRDFSLFNWRAPDGSAVLTWNTINGYGWGVGLGIHTKLDKDRITAIRQEIESVQKTTPGPIYLGWGTDLWAPTRNLIENIAVLNKQLAPDRFRLATPTDFFHAAAETQGIPNVTGEIPSSWANLTTSLVPLWPPAMAASDALVTAEKFAAINFALGYAAYPGKDFDSFWKDNLKSLDHNNDGQGGEIGDERKLGYAHSAELGANQILRDSLRNITERVKSPFSPSVPIVVFNSLNWQRDDLVKVHVSLFGAVETDDIEDYKKGMRLLDEKSDSVPFQVEQYTDGSSRSLDLIFIARAVPSIGYKTYYLIPANISESFHPTSNLKLQSDKDAKEAKNALGTEEVDNACYRVKVDRATGRLEIFDKELNRLVMRDAELVATEERGGDDQNIILPTGRTIINVIHRIELEENDAVRTVLRIEGNLGGNSVVQRISLFSGIKKIDIENTVEWKPGISMTIKQLFPVLQSNTAVRHGIPFGSATAADILPESGPHWEDEVSMDIWKTWRQIQDWVFVGTKEWGFTISSDSQLVEALESCIQGDMLRGTIFTPATTVKRGQTELDLRPPAGIYVFRYSFTSHRGDWIDGKSWRAGLEFRAPLLPVISANPITQKPLPPEQSFLSLSGENLVVTAIKKIEGQDKILLRTYEICGAPAESPVRFLGVVGPLHKVNMLEEDSPGTEEKVLRVQPYEISSFRLSIP